MPTKMRVVKAPFDVQLPQEIFYSLTFGENNGKTLLTLTGRPETGSDAEIAGFNSINKDMQNGFAKTFDKLAEYLAR
ncbi:SRPBCC domain-containing protein [Chitinophaga sp. GCM10012297]|uniref:SRPBCC domain-containing protein n=1 Tax=Chitinophaga TaxID=79328 RepID=UPI001F2C7C37|nr:SRPBCC domain-containing protein [Chitinophaga chungangae]